MSDREEMVRQSIAAWNAMLSNDNFFDIVSKIPADSLSSKSRERLRFYYNRFVGQESGDVAPEPKMIEAWTTILSNDVIPDIASKLPAKLDLEKSGQKLSLYHKHFNDHRSGAEDLEMLDDEPKDYSKCEQQ